VTRNTLLHSEHHRVTKTNTRHRGEDNVQIRDDIKVLYFTLVETTSRSVSCLFMSCCLYTFMVALTPVTFFLI